MPDLCFETPATLPELAACLARAGEDTHLLGGGTDLLLRLPELKARGAVLIDLGGVQGLEGLEMAGNSIEIGANATYARIAEDARVRSRIPCLAAMAARVGSRQIRNRACLPGNLANASPGGDAIGTLLALDARVRVLDAAGRIRELAVDELVTGIGKTSLSRREAIVGVRIPVPRGPWSGYGKLGLAPRRELVIANVGLTVVFDLDETAREIQSARIVLGATAPKAHRVAEAEALCTGRVPSPELAEALAEVLRRDVAASIGNHPAFQHKLEDVRALAQDVLGSLFPSEP